MRHLFEEEEEEKRAKNVSSYESKTFFPIVINCKDGIFLLRPAFPFYSITNLFHSTRERSNIDGFS